MRRRRALTSTHHLLIGREQGGSIWAWRSLRVALLNRRHLPGASGLDWGLDLDVLLILSLSRYKIEQLFFLYRGERNLSTQICSLAHKLTIGLVDTDE